MAMMGADNGVLVLYHKCQPSQKVHWGGVSGDRVVVSVADHKAKGPGFASQWCQFLKKIT